MASFKNILFFYSLLYRCSSYLCWRYQKRREWLLHCQLWTMPGIYIYIQLTFVMKLQFVSIISFYSNYFCYLFLK